MKDNYASSCCALVIFRFAKSCPWLKSGCVSETTAEPRNLPGFVVIVPTELVHPVLPLSIIAG